jgi:hypothetical protein
MHMTSNIRKTTYAPDDIMARNFNGAFETAVFGKWVRSVLQTAMHDRLMRTTQTAPDNCKTQLQSILFDAIATFVLVPCSTAVLLSAMQLYLTLVLLDVSVMLVSCMVLYYLQLPRHCPLRILALVARRREGELLPHEMQQYYDFASFLHTALSCSLVPGPFVHSNFSPDTLVKFFAGNFDTHALDAASAASPMSVYLCHKFFDASTIKLRHDRLSTTSQLCASSFAAGQKAGADPVSGAFWASAGPGTRIPIPHDRSNDRNHGKFDALNECAHLYSDAREKLTADGKQTALGVIVNFLRICDLDINISRSDLVMTLLQPWADAVDVALDDLGTKLRRVGGGHGGSPWTDSILNPYDKIEGRMLDWVVQPSTAGFNSAGSVGLGVDVLWLIIAQDLFAWEWNSDNGRQSVVHTRNMSGAAQTVLFLYLHTNIPKAAVPACSDGGVVLSEPSHLPGRRGQAVVIPYVPSLHVDSRSSGSCFLCTYMREPRNVLIVKTHQGSLLISEHQQLLDREAKDIGADVLAVGDVCPFPPESVAHMLPAMPSFMRAFRRMHHQFDGLATTEGSHWAFALRLFGSGADAHDSAKKASPDILGALDLGPRETDAG